MEDGFKKELEAHNKEIIKMAKKSVIIDLMDEAVKNDYTTFSHFNGAMINKLEELNDE